MYVFPKNNFHNKIQKFMFCPCCYFYSTCFRRKVIVILIRNTLYYKVIFTYFGEIDLNAIFMRCKLHRNHNVIENLITYINGLRTKWNCENINLLHVNKLDVYLVTFPCVKKRLLKKSSQFLYDYIFFSSCIKIIDNYYLYFSTTSKYIYTQKKVDFKKGRKKKRSLLIWYLIMSNWRLCFLLEG